MAESEFWKTTWADDVEDAQRAILLAIRDAARAGSITLANRWVQVLKQLEGMGFH